MAKISAFCVVLRVPIISQFYLTCFITERGEKNLCDMRRLIVISTQVFEAELVAVKIQ